MAARLSQQTPRTFAAAPINVARCIGNYLRTSSIECLHDSVVSNLVCHLFTEISRVACMGCLDDWGKWNPFPNGTRTLVKISDVSSMKLRKSSACTVHPSSLIVLFWKYRRLISSIRQWLICPSNYSMRKLLKRIIWYGYESSVQQEHPLTSLSVDRISIILDPFQRRL